MWRASRSALGQPRPRVPHRRTTRCAVRTRILRERRASARPSCSIGLNDLRRDATRKPRSALNLRRRMVQAARPGRHRHQRSATTSRATCCAAAPAGAGLHGHARLVRRGVALETETYTSSTRYDALNRPVQLSRRTAIRRARDQRHPAGVQRGQPAGAVSTPGSTARRAAGPARPGHRGPARRHVTTSTTTPRASACGSTTRTAQARSTTTTR